MGLSIELERPFPKIGLAVAGRRKSHLEVQADAVVAAYGGIAQDLQPSRFDLARVERDLLSDSSNLDRFSRRDLRAMPHIIWASNDQWRTDRAFLERYLEAVAERWRGGVKRMWRHHVMNFDPASISTTMLARWLRERQSMLPEGLKSLSQRYDLLDAEVAHGRIAAAVLEGTDPWAAFERVGMSAMLLRGSALMLATLEAAGRALSAGGSQAHVPTRLTALLAGNTKDAILETAGTPDARDRALRSLVGGLVAWQERIDPDDREPERTVDFLLALNGDPRFTPGRWRGRVDERSTGVVERWLSRKTLDAFFRIIDGLKTDRPDMWKERREFWLSYLPYVTKAWLVVGPKGVPFAEREGMRYARFDGSGTMPGHCGLMLQIRDLCVLEMNMNGSAVFWREGTSGLPGLYLDTYNRNSIRYNKDGRNVFVETHLPVNGWQRKFRELILRVTGLNVR
jgi:hypothetical protein